MFSERLRQLADWIDKNEIGDGAIIKAGIEVGGGESVIVFKDHDVLRVCFPGHAANLSREQNCDRLILRENSIRFEGWKFREYDGPKSSEVTL